MSNECKDLTDYKNVKNPNHYKGNKFKVIVM